MKITRLYTGTDQRSHFEDLEIPEQDRAAGWFTDLTAAEGITFRRTDRVSTNDFHRPSRRQFVLMLTGVVELECGDGSVRTFRPGDIILADDLTGQGHLGRDVEVPHLSAIIAIPSDFDLSSWSPSSAT